MVQRTIVSIYEVDEWAATGPWVGQGSLVNSGIVLVHPPLSSPIAAGEGPTRLRVGVRPAVEDSASGEFVEVIDVYGTPRTLWQDAAAGLALVALELRTPALSPVYTVPGVVWTDHDRNHFRKIAEHLQDLSTSDWGSSGVNRHSLWCKVFPPTCKH